MMSYDVHVRVVVEKSGVQKYCITKLHEVSNKFGARESNKAQARYNGIVSR
jgi:hypothetical protein